MKFMDQKHKAFYEMTMATLTDDVYHRSLVYVLGLTMVTRSHFEELYDGERGGISIKGLYASWQTGSSIRTSRLAFNLFNGYCGESEESPRYDSFAVDSIFSCELAPYFCEALKIRFPEYFQ